MTRGTLFVGCVSTDNYQTAIITWPDTKEKFVLVRSNDLILGEKKL